MTNKSARQSVETKTPIHVTSPFQAFQQMTVGVSANDCGKESCKYGRICQKTGDCPEEEA